MGGEGAVEEASGGVGGGGLVDSDGLGGSSGFR